MRPSHDLRKRYGGDWAVVTGGSDGIGEQWVYALADRGFNVIIMARSEEKMQKVRETVFQKHKGKIKNCNCNIPIRQKVC